MFNVVMCSTTNTEMIICIIIHYHTIVPYKNEWCNGMYLTSIYKLSL